MNGKERLEEIKEKYNYERLGEFIDAKPISPYELKWLIKQAERVQELEGYKESYEGVVRALDNMSETLLKEEQQNKRYREALELLVKQETLGKDVKTGKTAISYNGMIALKGLGIFNDDEYIVYGVDEVIESVLEESE